MTRFHPLLAACIPILACSLFLAGCENRSGDAQRAKEEASANSSQESEQLLESAVSILANDFQLDAYSAAISQLNLFVRKDPSVVAPMAANEREAIQKTFSPQVAEIASSSVFRAEDLDAFRAAFLCRKIVQSQQGGVSNKRALATSLFDWTIRHIALAPIDSEPAAPPASVAMRGVGDYRDRASMFCELLRQAQIPSVVVAVTTKQDPETDVECLCGAYIDGEIYLFDPWLGRGVPKPGAPTELATLRDLASDISIASARNSKAPATPIPPADVEQIHILIPFDATKLSPRAQFLESELSGDDRAILTLDYQAARQSATDAIPQGMSNVSVKPWWYPFLRIVAPRDLSVALDLYWPQSERQARRTQVLSTPHQARLEWVQCDLKAGPETTAEEDLRYQTLPIEQRRQMAGRGRSGIVYFAGVAQLDLGKVELAKDWFDRYLADFAKPELRERDIIEPALLCRQLAGDFDTTAPAFAKHLFLRLSQPARQAVMKGAQYKGRPGFEPAVTSEDAPDFNVVNPLEPKEMVLIVGEINRALAQSNFMTAESAIALAAKSKNPTFQMLAARAELTPDAIAWRNRLAFDFVFRESILPADRPWLVGVVHQSALVRDQLGQKTEAIQLLRKEYPTLSPDQSASLLALANALEASP